MKKLVGVGAIAACLLTGSTSEAEGQKYVTSWNFRVVYFGPNQVSEGHDPNESGPILMATGSRWRCERLAVSLTTGGALVGGFACSLAGEAVTIVAACASTSVDVDSSGAMIGTGSTMMRLSATCSTRAVSPTQPTKSIDKNL